MEQHAFYLMNKYLNREDNIYRVAFGSLIEAKNRETLTPGPKCSHIDNKSGEIGFIDMVVESKTVPKIKNGEYSSDYGDLREVLTIRHLGVEPEYFRQGYATQLVKRAEEIALEKGLSEIVAESTNEMSRPLFLKKGYTIFWSGHAIKKLH